MLIRLKIKNFPLKKRKKITILTLYLIFFLNIQFPRKSYIEFWVGPGREFLHLSTKACATSYLCETGFSAVAALSVKYCSVIYLAKQLKAAMTKLLPRYKNLCSKRQPHPSQ
jgi:hypothetical protein